MVLHRPCLFGYACSAGAAVAASAVVAAVGPAAAVAAVEPAEVGCPDECVEGRPAEAGRHLEVARSRLWPWSKHMQLWQQANPTPPLCNTRSASGRPMIVLPVPCLARVSSSGGRSGPRVGLVPPALGHGRTVKWPCAEPGHLRGPGRKSQLAVQVDSSRSVDLAGAPLLAVVLLGPLDVLSIPPAFPPRSLSAGSRHPGYQADFSHVVPAGLVAPGR